MTFYIGQRLVYDDALCTVRYYGPLDGTKGDWIGVEWDNVSRGKHNGTHQGQLIFQCLSDSTTAASFVRPNRRLDHPRTLIDAIKHKYGLPSQINSSRPELNSATIEISGKTVQEVGFEKIQQQISVLSDLRIVLVDGLRVCGLTGPHRSQIDVASAQADLGFTCPNIAELDLGWNPIEMWQDVADVSAPLRKLRILKASGLRLRSFEARFLQNRTSPFQFIDELHLNECFLLSDQVQSMLVSEQKQLFPSLKTLRLSQNELHSIPASAAICAVPSITSVILENNKFSTLELVKNLVLLFPNLENISLQGNAVASIGCSLLDRDKVHLTSFDKIESLNLAGNQISDFSFIDILPELFPNLTSLRLSKNPLYEQSSNVDDNNTKPSDSNYYLTLARIPRLKILNYTNITLRDREEGEIYYLSVAEKVFKSILASNDVPSRNLKLAEAKTKYRLYDALCTKYERDSIFEPSVPAAAGSNRDSSQPKYAPGSLGDRLIEATFYIHSLPTPPETAAPASKGPFLTRRLPITISVYSVKALLARHFGIPALQFRLVYESTELDPVRDTTMKSTSLGGGGRAAADEWEGWGDWDVDITVPAPSPSTASATQEERMNDEQERWIDGYLLKEGKRWKKRETEILDGMRGWGDFLESEVREARVRIEVFERL